MDAAARIEGLTAENERLIARVEQLEALLGMATPLPVEWRLTGAEQRVFGVLLARELATRDAMMAALYRDLGRDEAEVKIVDVLVCKIRAKLEPFGVAIETDRGSGYYLTPATKAKVHARLEQGLVAP